jgi:cysteinyl-tRNA synthetase
MLTKLGLTRDQVKMDWLSPAFLAALEDDLNTPLALSILFGLGENAPADPQAAQAFLAGFSLLGLEGWKLRDQRESERVGFAPKVEPLIAARSAARAARNWAEADRIRDELSAMGIQLMDSKDPATGEIVTTWEVKR